MGPDTEDRIKSITTAAAQQAAKEAVDLVYERLLPVLVQKLQRRRQPAQNRSGYDEVFL